MNLILGGHFGLQEDTAELYEVDLITQEDVLTFAKKALQGLLVKNVLLSFDVHYQNLDLNIWAQVIRGFDVLPFDKIPEFIFHALLNTLLKVLLDLYQPFFIL